MKIKKIYNCGPTLFDYVHIGCYRIFIIADILEKYFIGKGYSVDHGMNIMDVDDKILESNVDIEKNCRKYYNSILNEFKYLNLNIPNKISFTSIDYMDCIKVIKKLLSKNYAYVNESGIYLNLNNVKDYGKLTNLDYKNNINTNIQNIKNNNNDPSLWRFKEGEKFYKEFLNKKGRPGWDIQCATNCIEKLKGNIDYQIVGFNDVTHYENSCSIINACIENNIESKWIKVRYVNFTDTTPYFYMKDFIKNGYSRQLIKYCLYNVKYTKEFNLDNNYIEICKKNISKLNKFYNNLINIDIKETYGNDTDNDMLVNIKNKVDRLFENVQISEIIGELFKIINVMNKNNLNYSKEIIKETIRLFDYVNDKLDFIIKEDVKYE